MLISLISLRSLEFCLYFQISTPLVLQVKKIEIISAPKQNVESEAAPRMLKVTLSDGKTICHGVEFDHIQKLR